MKKLIRICFALALLGIATPAITRAADGDKPAEKHQLTDEQKAFRKQILEKYDTNKDGKLSKEERAAFSAEDKAQWEKLFPHKPKKDAN